MAATFGASTLPTGVTAPTDCAVQSVEVKESADNSQYRDGSGVTAGLVPHKLMTTEVVLEVKGKVPLTGVTAGAFTEGTLKQVGAKFSETVDDVPSGSLTYKSYATIS
jgi:hypothetical protein